MNDHENAQSSGLNAQQPASRRPKRPYVRPSFRWEPLAFETMALSCGKISSTQHQCHSNIKNS